MKNCIIASTSTVHGSQPLEYLEEALSELFKDAQEILFIPYARPGGITHEEYTKHVNKAFKRIQKKVIGIHDFSDLDKALKEADGIFTGGGNTFLLVDQLYKNQVLTPLKQTIEKGTPYLGTSAGSNICGLSMQTTNDMPIVYPPNFKTLGIIPFNINPHYLDPDPTSTHKGETRETRINEFHRFNTTPVVGLREGSWLRLQNEEIILRGPHTARIFKQNHEAYEMKTNSSLIDLN